MESGQERGSRMQSTFHCRCVQAMWERNRLGGVDSRERPRDGRVRLALLRSVQSDGWSSVDVDQIGTRCTSWLVVVPVVGPLDRVHDCMGRSRRVERWQQVTLVLHRNGQLVGRESPNAADRSWRVRLYRCRQRPGRVTLEPHHAWRRLRERSTMRDRSEAVMDGIRRLAKAWHAREYIALKDRLQATGAFGCECCRGRGQI